MSPVTNILEQVLRDSITSLGGEMIELRVTADYVQMLVSCDPRRSIHKVVKRIKRMTSRRLLLEFPSLRSRTFNLWEKGYFVETFGGVSVDRVSEFVTGEMGGSSQKVVN